jgi:hypothetical protein
MKTPRLGRFITIEEKVCIERMDEFLCQQEALKLTKRRKEMANIGDWLRRTEKPLEGKAPFD